MGRPTDDQLRKAAKMVMQAWPSVHGAPPDTYDLEIVLSVWIVAAGQGDFRPMESPSNAEQFLLELCAPTRPVTGQTIAKKSSALAISQALHVENFALLPVVPDPLAAHIREYGAGIQASSIRVATVLGLPVVVRAVDLGGPNTLPLVPRPAGGIGPESFKLGGGTLMVGVVATIAAAIYFTWEG